MSNRQGAHARRDATSGQIVHFQGPGAAALDQVIEVRTLEGQLQANTNARDRPPNRESGESRGGVLVHRKRDSVEG